MLTDRRGSSSNLLDGRSSPSSVVSDEAIAHVVNLDVVGFEERRTPKRDHVFLIDVHWSDKRTIRVRRSHEKLFRFQCSLLDAFPWAAGADDGRKRTIPFLPGKKFFRGNSRSVAQQRLPQLREYAKKLISDVDDDILRSDLVRSFFSPHPEDMRRSLSHDRLLSAEWPVHDERQRSQTLPASSPDEVIVNVPAGADRLLTL